MSSFLRRWGRVAAILGVAGLASCSSGPPIGAEPPAGAAAPAAASAAAPAQVIVRARARWLPVSFAELPGWSEDRLAEVWPALRQSCARPAPGWAETCRQAALLGTSSDGGLRDWLQRQLQPYRVEALDGAAEGLLTGYFEPSLDASPQPRGAFRVPLYGPPPDLDTRQPYWTRQQIDTSRSAQAALRGREIAYLDDPLDALLLHVQGSGRLQLRGADGSVRWVRVAYAGSNGQPYKSIGRWLIEQGELRPEQASWPAIRAWARRHPKRLNELLWSNPRYVFFREEPLPDPAIGPRGAQGVALTPERSIAVDPQSIPYGTPVWLASTEPLSDTPLRRLTMAQDTGSAITGAVRADYFWGWSASAEQQAGRTKQPLRLWVLWPRP